MNLGDNPRAIENQRKRLIIYTFATVGSLFLLSFGVASLVQGRHTLAAVLFVVTFTVMSMAAVARRLASPQPVSLILATILLFQNNRGQTTVFDRSPRVEHSSPMISHRT